MKYKILQENLHTALTHLQKALPSRPQLPILSSVLVQVSGSNCTISATDLYFAVTCRITVDSQEDGVCAVPGKQFREIVSSLNPGSLELQFKEGTLKLSSGKTNTSLACPAHVDFPPFPQIEGEEFVLPIEHFEKIEQNILFSTSVDQARPVLTAVLFEFSADELKVVSTDGFRLSVLSLPNPTNYTDKSFLLPAKSLLEVLRIAMKLSVKEVRFKVSYELKQVFFSFQSVEIFVRLIDGSFPPYQKIIPSVFTTEVVFDSQEMLENLKRAAIFSREASNIVRLRIYSDKVEVYSSSPSFGTYTGIVNQVKVTTDAEMKEIAFNIKYLVEYLSATKSDQQWLGMSESLKPALLKPAGTIEYQHVIMPFKVNA